jgi:Tfp pilus assembly protein PilF
MKCLETDPKRRFPDVREIFIHLETRSKSRLWFKLLRRKHAKNFRLAAFGLGLAAIGAAVWWLLPPEPRANAVEDWQRGVFDLQAGEPVQAALRLEKALAQHRLPAAAHAYLALAWHELGFADKAHAELNRALYQPIQPASDRRFEQAVKLQLAGEREQALPLLEDRMADRALLEDQLGKPEAEAHWKQVVVKSPNHPAAHLRLAMIEAKQGRWKEAEREFILADTYFRAAGEAEMVRTVSARRGIARFQNGDDDLARRDIPSLAGFLALPAGAGTGVCERTVTLIAGEADHFALPYDSIPYVNPDFAEVQLWPADGRLKRFDEAREDIPLFVSLILPPLHFCGGQLELRIRKGRNSYENDMLALGTAPRSISFFRLWLPVDDPEKLFTWDITPEVLMDVQRAQLGKKVTSLDIAVSQHTMADYIKLRLVY